MTARDERAARPENLGQVRRLIDEAFSFNRWDKDEQARYFQTLGLSPSPLGEMSQEDLRIVFADMVGAKMILIKEKEGK